jgi:stearoyl-CoA desaturase (delta-9 desaturase)
VPAIVVAVLVGLATAQVALFATTIYLHRTLSHKAVRLRPAPRMAFRVVIWISTGIKEREWVAVHRRHHAFTDIPGDPHSPVLLGYWRVQLTNAALYRRVARDGTTIDRYAMDLPGDRWDRLLFDHAFVGLAIGIGLLCLMLGWQLGLVAAAVHAVSYLALNAAINAIGHTAGSQPYPNTARNNQWLAWLTAGEGLHNNHHAVPTAARLALRRWEVDPAAWVIAVLERAHLATVRLSPANVLERAGRPIAR